MRVLVFALSLLLCSGCFIVEELDKGMKLLDQHADKSVKAKRDKAKAEAEAEAQAAAKNEGPGLIDGVVSWAEEVLEEEPPPPDPADFPIRCWINGKEHFRTRWDCESRGGTAVELSSR